MLEDLHALSFDCYGTLIDWQTGILGVMLPALRRAGIDLTREQIFAEFAALERTHESGFYRPYREILTRITLDMLGSWHTPDRDQLWLSIAHWPAFDEVPAALRALKQKYKLAIVSNIDNDLFELTRPKLGVAFDAVVTAEQVRAYKPAPYHFRELLARLGLNPSQVLHVAESRFHDIAPATALGMPTVWVDRTRGRPSASGPPSPGEIAPTFTVHSLDEVVALLRL